MAPIYGSRPSEIVDHLLNVAVSRDYVGGTWCTPRTRRPQSPSLI